MQIETKSGGYVDHEALWISYHGQDPIDQQSFGSGPEKKIVI